MAASVVVAHSFESTPFSHGTLAAYLREWHKREAFYEYLCATGPCGLSEPGAAPFGQCCRHHDIDGPCGAGGRNRKRLAIHHRPYFWIAGLSGDTAQLGLPTVHIGSSFSDIWSHLDFAASATAEARKDRFGVFTDIAYTKLSGDGKARGIFTDTVDVQSETFAALIGVGYTVFEDQQSHLDIVGGAKIWSVDTTISFRGGPLDGVSRDEGRRHGGRARQLLLHAGNLPDRP